MKGKLALRLNDAARSGTYRVRRPDEVLEAAAAAGFDVARIDLRGAAGRDALLERVARALAFPDWFGGNWDALEDCLADLSWREAHGHVLLLSGFETLGADDLGVLIDVLGSSAELWAERGRPFFAVFVDPARALGLADLFRER